MAILFFVFDFTFCSKIELKREVEKLKRGEKCKSSKDKRLKVSKKT